MSTLLCSCVTEVLAVSFTVESKLFSLCHLCQGLSEEQLAEYEALNKSSMKTKKNKQIVTSPPATAVRDSLTTVLHFVFILKSDSGKTGICFLPLHTENIDAHRFSKKTCKIVFVRTASNVHHF